MNIKKQQQLNYPIAWAKAICIMLMVVGHSGCPEYIRNMIYLFHVPLFFVCSGYFFKYPSDLRNLLNIIYKRIKGLWFPFVKWSLLFLVFNNIFVYLGVLGCNSDNCMLSFTDMLHAGLRILMMSDAPQLVAGFWFLRVLFISIIVTAVITYIKRLNPVLLVILASFLSIAFQFIDVLPHLSHSLSIILMGIEFHALGLWYKENEDIIPLSFGTLLLFFFLLIVTPFFFRAEMINFDRFTITPFIVFASVLSVLYMSSLKFIYVSKWISDKVSNLLIFVSNNTLEILALHFLCFKLVSFIIILYNDLPLSYLYYFPTIPYISGMWWILYSFTGIFLPLLIVVLFNKVRYSLTRRI